MKALGALAALVAFTPAYVVVTATLIVLDVAVTLRDLRRGDRAGLWR